MGKKNTTSKIAAPPAPDAAAPAAADNAPLSEAAPATSPNQANGGTASSQDPRGSAKKSAKPAAPERTDIPGDSNRQRVSQRLAQPSAASLKYDDIALRAYFIAEKRRALSLAGDEHQDWIEAERQLAAENQPVKKSRKRA